MVSAPTVGFAGPGGGAELPAETASAAAAAGVLVVAAAGSGRPGRAASAGGVLPAVGSVGVPVPDGLSAVGALS